MKDMIHRRRSKGKKGMKLSFNVEMSLSITKDVFLNDATNKQHFIALLGEQLSKTTVQCTMQNQMLTFLLSRRQLIQQKTAKQQNSGP